MLPKISVIIPAYNAGAFIGGAIDSILNQSYKGEIEIIVIDDGSNDDTKLIVENMARFYQQIICVPNERKKGPSGARNTGISIARGKYVSFLDADDIWLADHLREGFSFLEDNNDVDVVFFNFEIFEYEEKNKIGDWFSMRNFYKTLNTNKLDGNFFLICDDMFDALLDESFMHLQSTIIKKNALKNIFFNENIKYSEDRDFFIQLIVKSKVRCAYKNIITGIYFRRASSLTSDSVKNNLATALDHITIFSGYLSDYSPNEKTALKIKDMLFASLMFASYYYRKLDNKTMAIASLFKSVRYKKSRLQAIELAKILYAFVISFLRRFQV